MDLATVILVAIVSTLVGYAVSLWRSRLRPWVSLIRFLESQRTTDIVEITDQLYKATRESWFMQSLPEKKGVLDEVYEAYDSAKFWLEVNEGNEERIVSGISQLKSCEGPEDVEKVLGFLLGDLGISEMLEASVLRGEIVPQYDPNTEPRIKYHLDTQQRDGCYCFEFRKGILVLFGSRLNSEPYRKERLTPALELISRLDKENLESMFVELKRAWKEQRDVHRSIQGEAEQTVQGYSRWLCESSITNYGATPFILFPEDAKLCVKGKHVRDFELDCQLVRGSLDDDEEAYDDIRGVFLIKPGTTEDLAFVTKSIQREMKGGNVLRGAYESGDAQAFVRVQVLGREIPRKRWVESTRIVFKE